MKGNITQEQAQAARAHIGAWLKERRIESGLSQTELGNQLGIDQATVGKIEAGKWAISIDVIQMFLLHYGTSITDFFILTDVNSQK